jgi:hypothetical protein
VSRYREEEVYSFLYHQGFEFDGDENALGMGWFSPVGHAFTLPWPVSGFFDADVVDRFFLTDGFGPARLVYLVIRTETARTLVLICGRGERPLGPSPSLPENVASVRHIPPSCRSRDRLNPPDDLGRFRRHDRPRGVLRAVAAV